MGGSRKMGKDATINFDRIIEITGLNPEDYPVSSQIEVDVFDMRKRKLKDYEISEYGNNLFEKNPYSKIRFQELLENIETSKDHPVHMEAQLMDAFLFVKRSPVSEIEQFPRF